YHEQWANERLETLAVEAEFSTPIIDPDTGAELPGITYWERLSLDLQCSVYLLGAQALGFKPKGGLYDVLGKPRVSPLKATPAEQPKCRKAGGGLYAGQREHDETPEDFRVRVAEHIRTAPAPLFRRGRVVRFPADELAAARDICVLARRIAASKVRVARGSP